MALVNYQGPTDLHKMSLADLTKLAGEVRELIIKTAAENGGHLSASLGAVELAIALHATLNTPQDKIVWDVGHQAYAHKILTDRLAAMNTIRQYKGISGFPKRGESPYDTFTVGHASTSVSAAVGMARARDIKGENFSVFAVVGDGSFSGGMIMEALNNAGKLKNFAVILNDNGMSISKPVGLMSSMITTLRMSNFYNNIKKNTEKLLERMPVIGSSLKSYIEKLVDRTASLIIQEINDKKYAGFFQDLGFVYLGPIDGHNIPLLMSAIKYTQNSRGPLIIHIQTKKGKGYAPAEKEPGKFHGIPGMDLDSGELTKSAGKAYTKIFGEELLKAAAKDKKVVAITAAMADGTGLQGFAEKYPERFFDVGIAEEHAVTFAGGVATQGLKPVVAIYSTFLQRGYDQIMQDVALQDLPVVFAIDRGGLVGDDGPTHHGVFDLSYLRNVPGLILAAPKDGNELKDLFATALLAEKPFALRYQRGNALFMEAEREAQALPIGQAEIIHGKFPAETVIWAIGSMVEVARSAAMAKSAKPVVVINARFVKPLDLKLLEQSAKQAKRIITIEENSLQGGFGAAVAEGVSAMKLNIPITMLGIPDKFIEQGPREQLLKDCGLTAEALAALL